MTLGVIGFVDIKYNIKMFKNYRHQLTNRFVVSITAVRRLQTSSQFSLTFCIPSGITIGTRYIDNEGLELFS